VFEATKSPLAGEALKRIGELCAIEAKIAGQPAEARLVARQNCAVPILDALHDWLTAQQSTTMSPSGRCAPLRRLGHSAPLHQVSVNIVI
jgi:hypothetical protein